MDIAEQLLAQIPRGKPGERADRQHIPQAQWMPSEDVLAHQALNYDPNDPGGKVLLGAIGDRLIGVDDNRHILTVAGSRSGKSVTVIGNLFFYRGSVLCTDPKGELANLTAQRRAQKLKQKVYVLDPFQVVQGEAAQYQASFNPLTRLTLDNRFIVEDALQITDALVVSTGEEKDPHWNESAAHFIMGVILYVALSSDVKPEDRNLIQVRRIINDAFAIEVDPDNPKKGAFKYRKAAKKLCDELEAKNHGALGEVMLGAINGFYDKGSEERGSVLSTVRRNTQFLDFGSMQSVLQDHDFNLADLKTDDNGVSVYLVLPATRMSQCNRWLRLFVNQLLETMERVPGEPKYPILTVLDEFPVLGFMKQLQDAAGQIASFGVRLWIIMQDWGQGKSLYKDRFESFAANAGILQAFGNVDLTTTEYLSKRLGQALVEDVTQGEVGAQQRAEGVTGAKISRALHPLLTADEIARYFSRHDQQKKQLILLAGTKPIILQRVEYFDQNGPLQIALHHD